MEASFEILLLAELASKGRCFTQGYGRVNMTSHDKGVNQVQNSILAFAQALAYCISELLE